ncbi:MAG: LON peptidase substrate-binding domain-containing protein [Alphaproteobacteria bacterium]|nr:LON peptidase substrate-binding domain-containing protein [Alphaproteobacteria bacterium]MDE2111592.1 LON peptidase substrate-binding domain-containing protein [Alphaproteobacteria bacterium]MDE2495736.1 LON peptidase substrate-binding domain-containing protein [Alphaproteobacteria bacterium]
MVGGNYHSIDDLPTTLDILPLTGILLLPRGQLPLNVFEPRYLTLVDATLAGTRLIGMIQPTQHEDKVLKPALSAIGCAGRITSYRETDDGRYLITLTGICRFRAVEELKTAAPYRCVKTDFAPFLEDLVTASENDFPRDRLLAALKDYLSRRDLKADWRSVMGAPPETLVNALAMLCPFEPAEKQALLEAPSWLERVDTLVTLLEMSNAGPVGPVSLN